MMLLGYFIERCQEEEAGQPAYRLRDADRGTLLLFRYCTRPTLLYARDLRGRIARVRGHYLFTDEGGSLKCAD